MSRIGIGAALGPRIRLNPSVLVVPVALAGAALAGIMIGMRGTKMVEAFAGLAVLVYFVVRRDIVALALISVISSILFDWYAFPNLPVYDPNVAIFVALLALGVAIWLPKRHRAWIMPPLLVLWALLLTFGLFGGLGGLTVRESFKYYLATLGNAVVLFALGVQIGRDAAGIRRLFQGLAGVASFIALHSIVIGLTGVFLFSSAAQNEYLLGYNYFLLAGTNFHRAGSFLMNPDWNGVFMAMMIFIPLGLFFETASLRLKALYLTEVALITVALLFTFSTAGVIAAGIGVIVFAILVPRGRARGYFLGTLAVGAVVLPVVLSSRLSALLQHASNSNEVTLRLGLWKTALRIIAAHPVNGIGFGLLTYMERAEPYRVQSEQYRPYVQPHNSYLEIGAMAGLPVLILFLTLLLIVLVKATRKLALADAKTRALLGGGIVAATVMALNAATINAWTDEPLSTLTWLILGAVSSPALIVGLRPDLPHVRRDARRLRGSEADANAGARADMLKSSEARPHYATTEAQTARMSSGRPLRVCVPITAFPIAGGMRSVLAGVTATMREEWSLEYLTHSLGPDARNYTIRTFGPRWGHPANYPNVLAYAASGRRALRALLRRDPGIGLILAQDGVFTGAFAALVGKRAGIPVACMDHGNVTLLYSPTYRAERLQAIQARRWLLRPIERLRFALYMRSLRAMARVAARNASIFLAAGDDVADTWERQLGVSPQRITRFPFMVDSRRLAPLENTARISLRAQLGIPPNALVITMINRLAAEKGLDSAVRGIRLILDTLDPALRERVHVVIAGDGPLRSGVVAEVRQFGLESAVRFWGEATPDEVVSLLQVADVFLYTATRGINSMAVLEAMGAGCAIVATAEPRLIGDYLADGRGLAIPAGSVAALVQALAQALQDEGLRQAMGERARAYIETHHSPAALRQSLLAATRSRSLAPIGQGGKTAMGSALGGA